VNIVFRKPHTDVSLQKVEIEGNSDWLAKTLGYQIDLDSASDFHRRFKSTGSVIRVIYIIWRDIVCDIADIID
jgi:hypothetical protein